MKKIPIGISSFRELRENNFYFVDKSLMIQNFLDRESKVTLITRPRRFGKTLNMSMMSEFFDITKDSKKIFSDTKIMDTEYAQYINQYPTIFISFADAKREKKSVISTIKRQIIKEWSKYKFVFNGLNKYEQSIHDSIESVLLDRNNDSLEGIDDALVFLMDCVQNYFHKKVMVFIDEYDTPFIEAHVNGFYPDIRNGLSSLLHNSLKTSDSLACAMLTGIQRVAKENIFSDLNNLVVCDVTDKKYDRYFGFTTKETSELLCYYGLELNEEVKTMYDGYRMGNEEIYNPWSILNYADTKELVPYWRNTSSNTMIKKALKESNSYFKDQYESLIRAGYLDTEVNLQTSFYEVTNASTLWGLFVNAGYLTIEEVIDLTDSYFRIRIPNQEVNREFRSLTESYLSLHEGQLTRLARYLVHEQLDLFTKEYKNILMIPSYYDLTNENSYHMMMLGMCICLSNAYEVISNREEGKGRCDLILKAKDEKKTSFVLEFKYLKEGKEDIQSELSKLSEKAIQQIITNKYDSNLKGKIIYIGLAHHGKDVVIKWVEKPTSKLD